MQRITRIWGCVYKLDAALAAYFVEWTPMHEQKTATYDLIIGSWGEAASSNNREAVSLAFRVLDTGPSFMVQDASMRRIGSSPLVGKALDRDSVIGTTLADIVFAICDLVYLADPRIAELRT